MRKTEFYALIRQVQHNSSKKKKKQMIRDMAKIRPYIKF